MHSDDDNVQAWSRDCNEHAGYTQCMETVTIKECSTVQQTNTSERVRVNSINSIDGTNTHLDQEHPSVSLFAGSAPWIASRGTNLKNTHI